MNKISLLFILLVLISVGKYTKAQAPTQCQDVMLQAFYWDSYADSKWTNLNSKASEITSSFSLVWLPPSGNCLSNFSMGYAPVYWFDQNSAFGTQTELKTLISSLKANGTKAIADVVVNHRNGKSNWTDFPTETYNGVTYSMGPAQICSTDEVRNEVGQAKPTGAPDTGDDFNGARDLDHTSTIVQDNIKGYLQFLKNEMGYSGWRYDMTKGFKASYVNEYNMAAGNYFSVGEYFDGSYDLCKSWINGCSNNSTTFDFPLKFKLNASMGSGGMDLTQLVWPLNGVSQPAGLIHNPDTKRYAVTFVDNHDTYRGTDKFNGNILAAYAFLMGSPGVPCVFLAHWNANKTAISAMIAARHAVQLHSESSVTVNQTSSNIYVATATGLSGTLIVKIGSGNYTAPSDYTLAASGTDYSIWTKISIMAPFLSVSPSGGIFYDPKTVTMSTCTGAFVYYTTDNTAPSTSSAKYTLPIVISSSIVLRAIAYNPTTQLYSAEAVNNYTFSSFPTSLKVRFKAPAGWTSCKVYSWVGSTKLAGEWPGTVMTLETDGYYSASITGFTTLPVGVVFNNGTGSSQTVDLSASQDICWHAGALSDVKYTANEVTCIVTGVENISDASWRIYPNPTHDLVYFTVPAEVNNITITSSTGGKLSLKPEITAGSCRIDLSAYPSGVYYISLSGPTGNRITKAVMKY